MRAKNSLSSVFETLLSETVFGPFPKFPVVGISFVRFNRRENRCSLAILDCREAVKAAAATAESLAVLVHSISTRQPNRLLLATCNSHGF